MTSAILPPVYDGRSALDKWLQRFDICAQCNGWDEALKSAKLPAFLVGEALVVYLELPAGDRSYDKVRTALTTAFSPPEDESAHWFAFQSLALRDGESPREFLYELKRLLDLGMPGLADPARNKLLFRHFLQGLPEDVSTAIRAARDCATPADALKRAQALMQAKPGRPAVAVAAIEGPVPAIANDAADVIERVTQLELGMARMRTAQAAAGEPAADNTAAAVMAPPRKRSGAGRYGQGQTFGAYRGDAPRGPRCFMCSGFGHYARQCANNATARGGGEGAERSQRQGNGGDDSNAGRSQRQGNGSGAAAVRGSAGRF